MWKPRNQDVLAGGTPFRSGWNHIGAEPDTTFRGVCQCLQKCLRRGLSLVTGIVSWYDAGSAAWSMECVHSLCVQCPASLAP